ncbi:MAG: hypothetical protein A3I32_01160 [Candidatus Yanofskybacteria bacterium RIFCSPLOWO2_02_FULL_45_10]|uniref:DUF397 domain-containing protein n=2 Tax=Candidatus Yanofskyibacteriota TaxID=1752733 RepID=A0A1F8G5A2_9BACT|nr:MAG: hypothetical protein A3F25_02275 [Candidatus Yanofskybacteria bacterium RIFCSPHIGHO2_12_FULL_45_19b]OGN31485.1 MAG: hypothetical protein A3I32_01160 [Candidatus Yanofskybacteria bacterium RIFCSPLOWO2_02_FULL_45_10]
MKKDKSFPVKDSDFVKGYGTTAGGAWCVEIARKRKGVAVRDSKNREAGILFFTNNEWAAFTNAVKDGEFDPIGPIAKQLRR